MFARGCDRVPDWIELGSVLAERQPDSFAVYDALEHTTEVYTRVARDGFVRSSYGLDGSDRVALRGRVSLNVEDVLARYAQTPQPVPDMVTQYEAYRAREDCGRYEAYAGALLYDVHRRALGSLKTLGERELYFGALLAVEPTQLFADDARTASRARKVELLAKSIDDLVPLLSKDLDRRVAAGWQ